MEGRRIKKSSKPESDAEQAPRLRGCNRLFLDLPHLPATWVKACGGKYNPPHRACSFRSCLYKRTQSVSENFSPARFLSWTREHHWMRMFLEKKVSAAARSSRNKSNTCFVWPLETECSEREVPVRETQEKFEDHAPGGTPPHLRFTRKDLRGGKACGLSRLGLVVIIPTVPAKFATHGSEIFPSFGRDVRGR